MIRSNHPPKSSAATRSLPLLALLCLATVYPGWLMACPACRGNVDVLKEFYAVERRTIASIEKGELRSSKKGMPSAPVVKAWARNEAANGMHMGTLFAHLLLTDTQQRLELRFQDGSARITPATEVVPDILFITSTSALDAILRKQTTLDDATAKGWFVALDPALTSGDKE